MLRAIKCFTLFVLLAFPASASAVYQPVDRPVSQSFGSNKVLVIFVPSAPGDLSLLNQAAQLPGFGIGLMSPGLGAESTPVQMFLDIGQGARIDNSLYGRLPTAAGFFVSRGLTLQALGLAAIKRRAERVRGEVDPGRMAQELTSRGVSVHYLQTGRTSRRLWLPSALAAVGSEGSVVRGSSLSLPVPRSGRMVSFLVSRHWYGLARSASTDREKVFLIGVPGVESFGRHQLPLAISGESGLLTSVSTRTDGLVLSTDIAPTVTRYLLDRDSGIGFQGRPITVAGALDVESLERLDGRMAVIKQRRLVALGIVAVFSALIALMLALIRRRPGVLLAVRAIALTLFVLPAVMLLTAWLQPSALVEYLVVAAAGLGAGFLLATVVSATIAPVVAVAIAIGSTFVDLALGSHLTALSLMGSNPAYGARFYGLGNELEAYLAVSFLLALGLASDRFFPRHRFIAVVVALDLATICFAVTVLGADLGAVPVLLTAAFVTILALLGSQLSWRHVAFAVGSIALAIVAIYVVDQLADLADHVTTTLGGGQSLVVVLERRLELAYGTFARASTIMFTIAAAAFVVVFLVFRNRLLRPLADKAWLATRAGVFGACAATLTGTFVNDSGPIFLIIGAAEIAFFIAYVLAAQDRFQSSVR